MSNDVKKIEQQSIDITRTSTRNSKRFKSGYIVDIVILVVLIIAGYVFVNSVFGTSKPFMVVTTSSMKPTLNCGDVAVVKKARVENIKVGDIIAINVPNSHKGLLPSPLIHRVTEKWLENGEIYFKTRGDNEPFDDPFTVSTRNLVGKYIWKLPYIGSIVFLVKPLVLTTIATFIVLFITVWLRPKKSII